MNVVEKLTTNQLSFFFCFLQKVGMENRRDDEEAVLFDIGAEMVTEKSPAPSSRKRRLTKVADKGDVDSSSSRPTRSSTRSAVDTTTAVETVEAEEEEAVEPLKRRRLVKAADKDGAGSSSFDPTRPFMKFAADLAAAQEAKAIEIAESLKTKAPKAKVPFYYDKKSICSFCLSWLYQTTRKGELEGLSVFCEG